MKKFNDILYVHQPESDRASIERAVSLAENNLAKLKVISVIPPVTGMPDDSPQKEELLSRLLEERHEQLAAFLAPYDDNIDYDVLFGRGFIEVIRAVLRDGHGLVIKSVENPSWTARLFGSDDMHLLRKCPSPVWMLKPNDLSNYETILAAVDFNPWREDSVEQALNREIAELAGSLAVSDFAALHLVHAWDAPAEMLLRTWTDNPDETVISYMEAERARHRSGVDLLFAKLRESLGDETYDYLSPRVHMPQLAATAAIPKVARDIEANLVVMGTVGRTGIPGLFIGNTAESILEQLQCSVLALKPLGFVTPVALEE